MYPPGRCDTLSILSTSVLYSPLLIMQKNFTLLSLVWGFLAPPFIAAQVGSTTPATGSILSASATTCPNPSLGSGPSPSPSPSPSPGPSPSTGPRAPADPPDVFLRIPKLHVSKIELAVDDLQAEINLAAKIAGLVEINAGVKIGMKRVNTTVANVDAALELDIHLRNLVTIVNRTLQSLDLNPLLVNLLDKTTANRSTGSSGPSPTQERRDHSGDD